jgi:hypothetical protein
MSYASSSFKNATAELRGNRISRAPSEERAEFAVGWLAGDVNLLPSIGLAERIFQAASRIRRLAVANGYSSNRKRKAKSLAEIWRPPPRPSARISCAPAAPSCGPRNPIPGAVTAAAPATSSQKGNPIMRLYPTPYLTTGHSPEDADRIYQSYKGMAHFAIDSALSPSGLS